jgi:hypothetical protein
VLFKGAGNYIPVTEAASVKWALDKSQSVLMSVTKNVVDAIATREKLIPLNNDVEDMFLSDSIDTEGI